MYAPDMSDCLLRGQGPGGPLAVRTDEQVRGPRDGEREACAAAASQIASRYGSHARWTDSAALIENRQAAHFRSGGAIPVLLYPLDGGLRCSCRSREHERPARAATRRHPRK